MPGQNVRLTIDQDLQWKAETLLAAQVAKTHALSGTVVVMDVKTGNLLALAAAPTFDPASYGKAAATSLVDQALAGVYEPGSTSKVMTAAAALSEGVVTPNSVVTVPGTLHRADRTFHDAESHGTEQLLLSGVLAKSSNIGAIEVGERLSPQTMWTYLTKFGVGQPTGLNFPGESAGILANYKDWNGSQRYTVLFGQGLSVNAVQAAGIFQTIANNGLRMPPRLVDGYQSAPRAPTTTTAPSTGRPGDHAGRGQGAADHDGGRRQQGRHGARGRDPGLPGGRQDRHGPAVRPDVWLLPGVHRVVHRDGAGRQPAADRRGDPAATGEGLLRRVGRGAGLPADHELRAGPSGHPANRDEVAQGPDLPEVKGSLRACRRPAACARP